MHIDDELENDDGEDLTGADRGDNIGEDGNEGEGEGADTGDAGDAGDKARDDKGRFKKVEGEDDGEEKDEEDGEEEDEDEDENEDEDEGAAGGKGKNLGIRFNKMKTQRDRDRQRAEAAERRAAELEAQLAATKAPKEPKEQAPDPIAVINTELDNLYEQVEAARADGDTKTAATLQRQIDTKNREITRIEAEQIAKKTTTQQTEDQRFDAALDEAEAAHPELKKGSPEFDQATVKAVNYYLAAHEAMGHPGSKALKLALKDVFGAPAAKAKEEGKEEGKKDGKPPAKKVDIGKNAKVASKLPADMSTRGTNKDDQALDPEGLTDDEWDALPEAKKKSMRGDAG